MSYSESESESAAVVVPEHDSEFKLPVDPGLRLASGVQPDSEGRGNLKLKLRVLVGLRVLTALAARPATRAIRSRVPRLSTSRTPVESMIKLQVILHRGRQTQPHNRSLKNVYDSV